MLVLEDVLKSFGKLEVLRGVDCRWTGVTW